MSAQDNLSNELFFKAHRGLLINTSMGKKIDTENLGMHWSANAKRAEDFAIEKMHWPDRTGYVYHGEIPMSSVETENPRLRDRGFANFTGQDPYKEEEVPVKDNAPVRVTGRTTYKKKITVPGSDGEVKVRKRTYNPPREMRA